MRVTLVAAQSLDGFITKHDKPGTAFTSAADKLHFSRALETFDCRVLGAATYRVARAEIRQQIAAGGRRIVLTRTPSAFVEDAVPGGLEFTDEPAPRLIDRLSAEGHRECALLGGAQLHHLFLVHGLVDALWITIEPSLFGRGTPFLAGPLDMPLALESLERLPGSDAILVKYRVIPAPIA